MKLAIMITTIALILACPMETRAQSSCGWAPTGTGVILPVYNLTVFDDGTGPALYVGGRLTTAGGVSTNGIAKWDGASWSSLGSGIGGLGIQTNVRALTVFDEGTGPALYAGGDFTVAGGVSANFIAMWYCGSTISLTTTQASPGSSVFVNNTNLTPGNEYYNIFSLDLCPGAPGSGPFLGLCATSAVNIQFMIEQVLAPAGTPLTHFVAPSSYVNWGPFSLPPLTVDGVCFDFTGGVIGPVSQVARITIQ